MKLLITILFVIIVFIFLRKNRKTISPAFERLPTDVMHSFAKIQQGMEIYLAYEMEKRNLLLEQEIIKCTFRYLISAEQPPRTKQESCSKIIEILKEEPCIITTFKQAMRIKTMLLGKSSMLAEGVNLRMNLLNLGIQISEDNFEVPTPGEFVEIANKFYQNCKDKYSSKMNSP